MLKKGQFSVVLKKPTFVSGFEDHTSLANGGVLHTFFAKTPILGPKKRNDFPYGLLWSDFAIFRFFLKTEYGVFQAIFTKRGSRSPSPKRFWKKRAFKTETHHYWPAFFPQSLTGLKQYSSPWNLDSQSVAWNIERVSSRSFSVLRPAVFVVQCQHRVAYVT